MVQILRKHEIMNVLGAYDTFPLKAWVQFQAY
jgi:hypothetical protein